MRRCHTAYHDDFAVVVEKEVEQSPCPIHHHRLPPPCFLTTTTTKPSPIDAHQRRSPFASYDGDTSTCDSRPPAPLPGPRFWLLPFRSHSPSAVILRSESHTLSSPATDDRALHTEAFEQAASAKRQQRRLENLKSKEADLSVQRRTNDSSVDVYEQNKLYWDSNE